MRLKYLNFLLTFNFVFAKQQILNLAAYGITFYAAAVSCFFIQKADGLCHPLLKLSVLNLLRLKLESEVQFGEDYLIVCIANLSFSVIVVNYANDVFSECIACANCPTFVTTKFTEGSSIGGRVDVSVSRLVEVAYMQAIGARFVSGSAFPSEVCIPAVFTRFFASVFMIFIAPHIFSRKNEVRSEVVACTNVPDFLSPTTLKGPTCSPSLL